MFMVKNGKIARLQLTLLLRKCVLLTENSTVLILKTQEKTGKKLGSLIPFHMTFRKIQCLWMKLKALTRTYHLNFRGAFLYQANTN